MKKEIKIKLLDSIKNKYKFIPNYSTAESAGLDLHACIEDIMILLPKEKKLISTGISIHINDSKLAALILPRSGLGHTHGIILGNSIGLIDSDYQGQLMVSLWNVSKKPFFIYPGNRIAQMIFISITKVNFIVVKSFETISLRGEHGFGHSGV